MKAEVSRQLETVLPALRRLMEEADASALLITSPANVRYLTGFSTPEDGRVLITASDAWLLTDARYDAQAAEESALPVRLLGQWTAEIGSLLPAGALAFESQYTTVALQEDLAAGGRRTVPLRNVLKQERMIKAPHEVALLREAARITDAAFTHILSYMRPGLKEIDVALELSRVMRAEGSEGDSFETIVAGGHRSAMPHGVASARVLETGDLVTMDYGATRGGYHADMTRAVALGPIDPRLQDMYAAVLEALEESVAMLAPGVRARDVDARARDVLEKYGLRDLFAHSLGHGTGLLIHEEPRLSSRSDQILEPGMIVTVEPGVYIGGFGGLRIEDLCLITEDGAERLSHSPRDLITL